MAGSVGVRLTVRVGGSWGSASGRTQGSGTCLLVAEEPEASEPYR
jgi:hypothetical protein